MKQFILLIVLVFQASVGLLAQSPIIKIYGDICRFQNRQNGEPYIEAYVAVPGTSISYLEHGDGTFDAKVNLAVSIEKLEEDRKTLYFRDAYNLVLGEERRLADTTLDSRRKGNLVHSHSVALEPGRYLFRAIATDSNATSLSQDSTFYEFEVETLPQASVGFSDLKWVVGAPDENKGGRRFGSVEQLIPMVSNNIFINEDFVDFYHEIYNMNQLTEDNFLIRSVVYRGEDRLFVTETRGQGRTPGPFNAHIQTVDIRLLPSGTYYMQVEVVSQNNRPIRTYRQVFYIYNSRLDANTSMPLANSNLEAEIFGEYTEEELDYYLQTLMYASSQQEQNFIKALENYEQKKNFLYNFFEKRKLTDKKTQDLWNGHLAALKYVNQEFRSSFRPGWQTDRGRVFIKYGIPNDVERHPSKPNLVPYEIWRYNRVGSQTNVIFIFFDPDLATNEYDLLHSTKYGERNNPRWRTQLTNGIDNDIDFERNGRTSRFNSDLEIDE